MTKPRTKSKSLTVRKNPTARKTLAAGAKTPAGIKILTARKTPAALAKTLTGTKTLAAGAKIITMRKTPAAAGTKTLTARKTPAALAKTLTGTETLAAGAKTVTVRKSIATEKIRVVSGTGAAAEVRVARSQRFSAGFCWRRDYMPFGRPTNAAARIFPRRREAVSHGRRDKKGPAGCVGSSAQAGVRPRIHHKPFPPPQKYVFPAEDMRGRFFGSKSRVRFNPKCAGGIDRFRQYPAQSHGDMNTVFRAPSRIKGENA